MRSQIQKITVVLSRSYSKILYFAASLLSLLVLLGVVLGFRFSVQGEKAMELSDQAFDEGDFIESIFQAERAGLLYFPGAAHYRRAEERLLSVARGSESEGETQVSLAAWRALALINQQTNYWGRGETRYFSLTTQALKRLEEQSVKKVGSEALWKKRASEEDHSALLGPQSKQSAKRLVK